MTIKIRKDGAWVNAAGGGGGITTVMGSTLQNIIVHGTNYGTTGLSATITPSTATKKILVMVTIPVFMNKPASVNFQYMDFDLRRNGTSLSIIRQTGVYIGQVVGRQDFCVTISFQYVDSPSSPSAFTYEVFARSQNATTNYWTSAILDFTNTGQAIFSPSHIILTEVN